MRRYSHLLPALALPAFLGCDPSFDDYTAPEASARTTSSWAAYGGPGGQLYLWAVDRFLREVLR